MTKVRELLEGEGRKVHAALRYVGGIGYLAREALSTIMLGAFRGVRVRRNAVFEQMVRMGVGAIPIVAIVLFFIGMILTFQMAYVLKRFGMLDSVASVVGIAVIRELGPLIVGVVLAGYVGASIAAELGTMTVQEEILALETSALNPVRFLVVPRLLAIMVMQPCLTLIGDVAGIFGGFLVGTWLLGIDRQIYMAKTIEYMANKDIYTGLVKAEAFALIIGLISCYEGFNVTRGAEGVGKATTRSVVLSIVVIIAADCFFTTLFYFVLHD